MAWPLLGVPLAPRSYCASLLPMLMRDNLEAMGMRKGYVGNISGYVVVDYPPLIHEGRAFHDSVVLHDKAPPPVKALWKTLLGQL